MERYAIHAIFRKWPDGSIDALFPYEAGINYRVMGYTKIGQHFEADYDICLKLTAPATKEEYQSLLNELTHQIGYDVTVIKRASRDRMIKAWDKLSCKLL